MAKKYIYHDTADGKRKMDDGPGGGGGELPFFEYTSSGVVYIDPDVHVKGCRINVGNYVGGVVVVFVFDIGAYDFSDGWWCLYTADNTGGSFSSARMENYGVKLEYAELSAITLLALSNEQKMNPTAHNGLRFRMLASFSAGTVQAQQLQQQF